MSDINRVVLVGNLTKDVALKYTAGGMAIGELSIAVNSRRKVGDQWQDEASFFDVTLFGKSAEGLQPYLVKGKKVGVDGRLQQQRWQNQEGQSRSKVVVLADNVALLGGRDEAKPQSAPQQPPRPEPQQQDAFGADDFPGHIPF